MAGLAFHCIREALRC